MDTHQAIALLEGFRADVAPCERLSSIERMLEVPTM